MRNVRDTSQLWKVGEAARHNTKVRRALWIPAAVLVVLVVAAVVAMNVYDHGRRDRIAPGIAIGGVPVGTLTDAQARAKVDAALHERLNQDVVVRAGEHRFTLAAEKLHRHVDVAALVSEAVGMSHRGGIVTRTLHGLKGTPVHADLPISVEYSKTAVQQLAAHVGKTLDQQPVNATVTPAATGLKETAGHDGVRVAEAPLRKRLNSALAKPVVLKSVSARLVPVHPKVSTADLADKYPSYIIVDRKHFTLRLFRHLKLDSTYPIAVGRQGLETPAGLYDVQWRQVNPSWYVPNSPWAGKLAGKTIPPGPDDPIKARWMGFNGGAGIHGIDPSEYSSIGHTASHGCVRMRIPDVIAVYDKTDVGTPVFVA
jgi:lipoprotein-anchoring transpeptidase ErfK/SrfK